MWANWKAVGHMDGLGPVKGRRAVRWAERAKELELEGTENEGHTDTQVKSNTVQ